MRQTYLIVVERDFVRDTQIATVPEADHQSDDWADAQGELVLGPWIAETSAEAIGYAALYHHVAGDVLKAYPLLEGAE